MPEYHKNVKQSNEKSDQQGLFIQQLTMLDIQKAVKGRFASFCTAVGIQALMAMMEQDVEAVAGPKGKHNPDRTAYRHGYQSTTIPMGNQRLAIERPRARCTVKDRELPIPSYEAFANDEQLIEAALGRMLYGMSARDYTYGIEDHSDVAETSGTSKSTISRRFIKASEAEAKKLLGRRFEDEYIPVLLIDGLVLGDYTAIVAMGINSDGRKLLMGVRIGSTENARVCQDLLADLIDRGLKFHSGLLAVIDGSKALRKALKTVFGHHVLVQRCQVHKMRNVLDYLPNYKRTWVKRRLQQAWSSETFEEAKNKLHSLANSLKKEHPDAAASLREGLEETITILKLEIPGLLQKSLRSTNAIESGFSMVTKNMKNVKNWKNGTMVQRWLSAALLDAERRAHRIQGYRSMSVLIVEIKRLTIKPEVNPTVKESNIA
jgi:putative transposase